MKEKKQSDIAVLLGYAGNYKGLTFLGLGLSAVAMVLGMAPYICIWPLFVRLLTFVNWRMALACLWGVPVAFALLFGSRKLSKRNSEITKEAGIQMADGIQETLENIREIRATNQEDRFFKLLNDKIDYHEKTMIHGELSTGIFVNAASVIMRLGVATTILTGSRLILSGQIDFMVLFMFLLAITRIYAPFSISDNMLYSN